MKATTFFAAAMSLFVSVFVTGCSDSEPTSALSTDSTLLSSTTTQAAGPRAAIRLRAKLEPTKSNPLASGNAKWEKQSTRTKFSVEVEDMKQNGKHLVTVDGTEIGVLYVKDGIADLNLDSAFGHTIPQMKRGQVVEVFNNTGELVLKGSLLTQ